jgi:hypothetical protein
MPLKVGKIFPDFFIFFLNYFCIMKTVVKILFSFLLFLSVSCKEKYEVENYFSAAERDSLLTDIITYIYIKPQSADWKTRFEPKFRPYFINQLEKFQFEKYFISEKGVHYFFIIRPARSAQGSIRGVGGYFNLDNKGKIVSFKEIFNTPVAPIEELRIKGEELFKWMIMNGNVNDYLKNPDYVEWPNEWTYYDTIQHEWAIKPGI